jgi:hypothetical protein
MEFIPERLLQNRVAAGDDFTFLKHCKICFYVFVVFLSLSFILPAITLAQGFSLYNNRNHPELKWMQAETEHFLIMYPDHLSGIENEAAAIAEETYQVLSSNLGVTFRQKIRIYLSDEDEIVNGFAVPIGSFYTHIWVNQNDVAGIWTGREKWLRKVIAHELAHIFHFQAVRGSFWPLDILISDPLPSFWTEGLAQYQTEQWDAVRGDRMLRTSAYESDLDYRSGSSVRNGELLYASGNSQLRFFAEQYGDSTLAALLGHRKPVLLGLGRVHDFRSAFRSVTGDSYTDFQDRWKRHISIYYHTLAGQMERLDSLATDPMALPVRIISDVQPDTSGRYLAVTGLRSNELPVRQLWWIDTETGRERLLADGSIGAHVSIHPEGNWVAYHRLTRGRHGSLLNELYRVHTQTGRREQLTRSRRASYPAWMADGRLAFIGSEAGTGNIYLLNTETGTEEQLTFFEGDVQLADLRRQPGGSLLAFHRFDETGFREILILDPETGDWFATGNPEYDNRMPVWSHDGRLLAFTSLRDEVPNIFVTDPFGQAQEERVTLQFTGARAHGWLAPDSLFPYGRLLLTASDTRTRDYLYQLDAASRPLPDAGFLAVNPAYATWTGARPSMEIPARLEPDASLIHRSKPYCSWCNLQHNLTLPYPYYASKNDWGAGFVSVFTEPLGKHTLLLGIGVSAADPGNGGFALMSYINRQLTPTLNLNLYHRAVTGRFFGDDLLFNRLSGIDAGYRLPLDWINLSYTQLETGGGFSIYRTEPTRELIRLPAGVPMAEKAAETRGRMWLGIKRQRPYRFQALHPLDGFGARLQLSGAIPLFGGTNRFIRPDLRMFAIIPGPADHRIYVYGRAIVQQGRSLRHDFIGLTRYGDLALPQPGAGINLLYGDGERVRGYLDYAIGNRLLFGSIEYRMPVTGNLQTRVLGIAEFGGVVLAPFIDAGMVWSGNYDPGNAVRRAGSGIELKNLISIGGLQIKHVIGLAQPVTNLFSENHEVYYRIKLSVPF